MLPRTITNVVENTRIMDIASGRRANNGSPSTIEILFAIASRLIPDRKLMGRFQGSELGKEATLPEA